MDTKELFAVVAGLIGAFTFIGVLYAIIELYVNQDEIKDAIDERLYKKNPELYIYKRLKKGKDIDTLCWDFFVHFANNCLAAKERFLGQSPSAKRDREICLNGFRFMLGLLAVDKELQNYQRTITNDILLYLSICAKDGEIYNCESENIKFGKCKLLKIAPLTRIPCAYGYTFCGVDGEVFEITSDETHILTDERLMSLWKDMNCGEKESAAINQTAE